MPFPADLKSLLDSGYTFLRSYVCPECGEIVEIFRTPGGREIEMNQMCLLSRPAIRHYETCNPKENQDERTMGTNDAQRRDSDSGNGGDLEGRRSGDVRSRSKEASIEMELSDGGCDAQGSGIKLYGVTDKNIVAVGWQAGTLAVRFHSGLYHYANVPEHIFETLRRVPYVNSYFTKAVKNHPELYPCSKVG